MSISYSDCSRGYMYGEDGRKLSNWNPDLDYGNEYVNIHFRMEAKGFGYPSFMFSEADRIAFDKEIAKVFTSMGWECETEGYNGSCATWRKGKAHLYLHPQDFSGEVLKNDVKKIAEALEHNATFSLRWVDLYKTSYDMSDEEYQSVLESKEQEIKAAILEVCKTRRTSLFVSSDNVAYKLADRFRVERVGENDGKNYGVGQTSKYIKEVLHKLVAEGYLVMPNLGDDVELVRTINKSEQRVKKLFVA